MKYKITLLIFLSISVILKAQNELPVGNTIKLNNISVELAGAPAPFGISYGQMISDRFSLEFGAGFLAAGVGLNYYITNPRYHRFNVYTGLALMNFYDGDPALNIPLGISYFAKNNFQYSLDIGLLTSIYNTAVPVFDPGPLIGLKVGYRFGPDVSTIKERELTNNKNIISLRVGGVFYGFIYERLLNPKWGIEAGLGFLSATVGTKYYYPAMSKKHINFYIGVSEIWSPWIGLQTYIPIGMNILTKNGFRFSLDMGPNIFHEFNFDLVPLFSVSVGKAF